MTLQSSGMSQRRLSCDLCHTTRLLGRHRQRIPALPILAGSASHTDGSSLASRPGRRDSIVGCVPIHTCRVHTPPRASSPRPANTHICVPKHSSHSHLVVRSSLRVRVYSTCLLASCCPSIAHTQPCGRAQHSPRRVRPSPSIP